jgi:ABC-2 type transport system permease protein
MSVIARQALLMAVKDTRVFFKDKFAVGFAFLFPFLFVIGFSFTLGDIGPSDDALELAISTQEDGGLSSQIIEWLTAETSGTATLDYPTALSAVEDGSLAGFVAFPPDFTDNVMAGRQTTLEVIVGSGSSPEIQAALHGLASSIADDLEKTNVALSALFELSPPAQDETLSFNLESAARERSSAVTFEVETIGEVESVGASNFTLPAYLTMFVFFVAAMSAESIARERQGQTLERLLSNGARRESIILGKFVGIAFRGLLQLAVLWAAGILIFGIDLGLSPVAVVLISVLMALTSAAFGVMLASFVVDIRAASTAGVLVSLTLAPIGGCWWPLFITPEWMQSLAKLTPHGWANGAFNKLMLFGAEFSDVSQEMIALAAFGAAFLAIALWRFRLSAT